MLGGTDRLRFIYLNQQHVLRRFGRVPDEYLVNDE
jgi:hypothetical protein